MLYRSTPRARTAVAALVLALAAPRAQAQVARADSLLAAGRLARAESIYFAHAAARPRDPVSRAALGRYLASRGAFRVGAVLLEEARLFGGDPATVARELAPIYRTLGDYRALAAMPSSGLTMGERAQAAWLVSRPTRIEMRDSAAVPVRAAQEEGWLATLPLRIGRNSLQAGIDPARSGVVLDLSLRGDTAVREFRLDSSATITGVVATARLGTLVIENLPVRFERLPRGQRAAIGLDVLARLAPTLDVPRGELVLRRDTRLRGAGPGERLPVFLTAEPRLLLDGALRSMTEPAVAAMLRGRRWTLDVRRGELLVDR